MSEQLSMAELKNRTLGFDRAEMWDIHAVREPSKSLEKRDQLCKRHMGVWNIDKNQLACIAKKSYTVIQHKHAVESVIEAISALNIESTAELRVGKHDLLIDFDFPKVNMDFKEIDEQFTGGIRLESDYSTSAGLVISARLKRVKCLNGMVVDSSIVKPRRIKYTEQLNIELEGIIDKIVKDVITGDEKLASMVSICMKDSVEWQAARLLAKALFKIPKHVKGVLSKIKIGEDERVTRWSFYNAITEYCTQGQRLKPNIDTWLQNKAQLVLKSDFNDLTEQLTKIEVKTSS